MTTQQLLKLNRKDPEGFEFVLLKGKKELTKFRFVKPNFKAGEIELLDQSYLIYKTGFLDSEIYLKKKFKKKPGFEMAYNWRMNTNSFEVNGKQYYLLPRDFEGMYFAWYENKTSLVMEYQIVNNDQIAIRDANILAGNDFMLLLLAGFFIIFPSERRKRNIYQKKS